MIRGYYAILGPHRGRLTSYLAWVIGYGVLQGAAMVLLVPIARAVFHRDFDRAAAWIAVLAVLVVAAAITHYVQSIKAFRMALVAMRSLHHRLGDHLVTLPLGWFTRDTVGKVSQIAVKGTMFVGTVGAHLITPVALNSTAAGAVVVGLLCFDWRIGLVAAAGGVLLLAGFAASTRIIANAENRNHGADVAVNNQVIEFARAQPVLRSAGRGGPGYPPLVAALERQRLVGRRALWGSVLGLIVNGVAVQLVFSAIIGVGCWLVVGGDIDPITLLAVVGLAARFTSPLAELAEYGSAMRMATAEIQRIAAVLNTPAMPVPESGQPVARPGDVELRDVSFGYDTTPVLREVNLHAVPGTMTALVGPSGSGKTTITRLIARFYDADAGTVLVGGVDVRQQDTATLMSQLALVFQDVYLFDDSLWENVRVGRPDASDTDILAAADTAGVLPIVQRLPQGWDTAVGEAGSALSGGERQRVSIARALLKNAPIVLFDEATSALDPENEHHVAESIRQLARESTVIVIAHKLSTVTAADAIIVLGADGGVIEKGTHDMLLAEQGQYARFWQARVDATGWVMTT